MLRTSAPAVISINSQFLCCKVWQFAAGASTAGFLERAAPVDLERELRTFKYPAMSFFPGPKTRLRSTLDETQREEGAMCSDGRSNIVGVSRTALLALPGEHAKRYVRDAARDIQT